MTRVLLIYPYFKPRHDRSVFRFPPLGISYIASSLINSGHEVTLLDCTFLEKSEALHKATEASAKIVGIYCMVTMLEDCLWLARCLRPATNLLIAGGPLPTCDPHAFTNDFDVIVRGEGEATILELVKAYSKNLHLGTIPGITMLQKNQPGNSAEAEIISTPDRPYIQDLDRLPFPARQLLPNHSYIQFGREKYGYSITTLMSTRGCPYECEFCSNVIFGGSYRERSASNVADEIEQVLSLGYDRISFADDVFTLRKKRVLEFCAEITTRGLKFYWECLARVDSLDEASYIEMYKAGCRRVYFGIESGDESTLKLMKKKITPDEARQAVWAAHRAGIEVGAFFILFYPGESSQNVLNTLHFLSTLPLDYVGLTMPYPLPGTALYERVKPLIKREWLPGENIFSNHVLIYNSEFSEVKMWFGIIKGHIQSRINRRLGRLAPVLLPLFEVPTDWLFMRLK